jgi:hypothetical protein
MVALNPTPSVYSVYCCAIYAKPPSVVKPSRRFGLGASVSLWFNFMV